MYPNHISKIIDECLAKIMEFAAHQPPEGGKMDEIIYHAHHLHEEIDKIMSRLKAEILMIDPDLKNPMLANLVDTRNGLLWRACYAASDRKNISTDKALKAYVLR